MNFFLFSRALSDKDYAYKLSMWSVLIAYIVIYFLFLYQNQFLPYAFDNNETFSSLIHAQNLFHFGLQKTFGLTDEAYGLLKQAHPYVYTHQGNFPRFYTFFLYYLGVKSAELHILITTFTIGLAGIWLCHRFFAKYVSCLFAAIFCLLLMTDYIMFAQWHINTWRVWHLFFFFSSFLCCHALNKKNRNLFILLALLNFACLYYTEIVYASFVFFSTSIYLFLLSNESYQRKISNFTIFALGSALGIAALIIQNVLYLGWEGFLQDLNYTFSARNQLLGGDEAHKIIKFYNENKIVFWDNFNEFQKIRNPLLVIKNFYRHCLLPYGAFMTLCALLALLGPAIAWFFTKLQAKHNTKTEIKPIPTFLSVIILCLFGFLTRLSFPSMWDYRFPHVSLLLILFIWFSVLLFKYYSFYNHSNPSINLSKIDSTSLKKLLIASILLNIFSVPILIAPATINAHLLYKSVLLMGFFILFTYTTLFYLYHHFEKSSQLNSSLKHQRIKQISIGFLSLCFLISLVFLFFVSHPIDRNMANIALFCKKSTAITVAFFSTILFIYLINDILSREKKWKVLSQHMTSLILYFALVIILSFATYYMIRFSGNMAIQVQNQTLHILKSTSLMLITLSFLLTVVNPSFYLDSNSQKHPVLDTLRKVFPFFVATGLGFILVYLLFPGYVRTGYWLRYCCFTVFAHITIYAWLFFVLCTQTLNIFRSKTDDIFIRIKGWMNLLVLITLSYLWLASQYTYLKEFPASDFNFVKLLTKNPFKGHAVVANTYAAPFSYTSGAWAYSDPVFAQSQPTADVSTIKFKRDYRYLWFADFDTNPRYQEQTYFVCWQSYYSWDLLNQPKPSCADFPIIQYVRNHPNNALGLKEIEHDTSGRDKWSIVLINKHT